MAINNNLKIKGAIWNILGSTIWGANSFVILLLVSRMCSVTEIGEFGIAFTTAQIIYSIGLFGLDHYQMTDYSEKYVFSCYCKARKLSCALAALSCALAIVVLRFEGKKIIYTVLLTGFMLINVYGNLYESRFFQKNRLDYSGKCLFFRIAISMLVFIVTLVLIGNILIAICLQTIAAYMVLLYYIYNVAPLLDEANESIHVNYKESLISLAKECFPFVITVLIMNVLSNISKYGIDLLLNDEFQGFYNMLFMPANVINLCSHFIFRPYLSEYADLIYENRVWDFGRLFLKQIIFVLTLTGSTAVLAFVCGTDVLGWIYGKDLGNFSKELTVIIIGGGALALGRLFYFVFLIMRKQKILLCAYLIGLMMAFFSLKGLILNHDILGAAFSFLLSHMAVTIIFLLYMLYYFKMSDFHEK